MTSPSKLHRLHRFFRHEDGTTYECYWNVAAGAIEQYQRLYRVLYKSSTIEITDEITIDVKKPELLKDYFWLLTKLLYRTDLDPKFQEACSDLLAEDPWLSMFDIASSTTTTTTDSPQQPDMLMHAVVSM
jgi:hypothetical protein